VNLSGTIEKPFMAKKNQWEMACKKENSGKSGAWAEPDGENWDTHFPAVSRQGNTPVFTIQTQECEL